MRCLLFDSIQQGTQYCEECFLQVLLQAQDTYQVDVFAHAAPAPYKHSCLVFPTVNFSNRKLLSTP